MSIFYYPQAIHLLSVNKIRILLSFKAVFRRHYPENMASMEEYPPLKVAKARVNKSISRQEKKPAKKSSWSRTKFRPEQEEKDPFHTNHPCLEYQVIASPLEYAAGPYVHILTPPMLVLESSVEGSYFSRY